MANKEWTNVRVREYRVSALKKVSEKIRFSVPQCVDEAIELWLRDVANKRIKLSESIIEKR